MHMGRVALACAFVTRSGSIVTIHTRFCRSYIVPDTPVPLLWPHSVTLAYDDTASDQLPLVFTAVDVQPAAYGATTVSIGAVGPYGTVLRGQDFGVYPIPPPAEL